MSWSTHTLPPLPHHHPAQVANLTTAVIKQLRDLLGPHVPIIILEGHIYTNNWIKTSQASQQLSLASAQHTAVNAIIQSGDTNLHYVEGEGKLGDDPVVVQESTGGIGVHPSSLAHLHMAQFVADKIRHILL